MHIMCGNTQHHKWQEQVLHHVYVLLVLNHSVWRKILLTINDWQESKQVPLFLVKTHNFLKQGFWTIAPVYQCAATYLKCATIFFSKIGNNIMKKPSIMKKCQINLSAIFIIWEALRFIIGSLPLVPLILFLSVWNGCFWQEKLFKKNWS